MPLFRRSDGDLIKDLSPVRAMMPYLMPARNESVVYHEQHYDISRARAWLAELNRDRPKERRATLFHLYLWSCARALHANSGLNRFVSGGRIYQRRSVDISFAAKRSFDLDAPLVTVKVPFPETETFDACVQRILALTGEGRRGEDASGKKRQVDTEVKLAMKLPRSVLRAMLWLVRRLDRVNLMPASMIRNDPMYASMFIANLGSVGLDNTYHHLYEYGTIPLFGVIGATKKHLFVDEDGTTEVRDAVQVRWTFDERINDGFYCAHALKDVQRVFEDPAAHVGPVAVAREVLEGAAGR